jgi:hypothetical protein
MVLEIVRTDMAPVLGFGVAKIEASAYDWSLLNHLEYYRKNQ